VPYSRFFLRDSAQRDRTFFEKIKKNRPKKKFDQFYFFSEKKNIGPIKNLKIGFSSEFEYECPIIDQVT